MDNLIIFIGSFVGSFVISYAIATSSWARRKR